MTHPTLKPGWKTVKFGDVVRQVKDRVDPKESGLKRYIAGEHMTCAGCQESELSSMPE